MLPSMGREAGKRPKTKPHLVIRIKEGWRFDEGENLFVSAERQVDVKADLPPRSRVQRRVPELAQASESSLTPPERELLRDFTVVLPAGSSPSECLKIVRSWPCVEDAGKGPEPELPRK